MGFPYNEILVGDALEQLRALPAQSVHCVVTSPPYWGLRDYGVPHQLGLEPTPDEYVEKMVVIFREVRRILRLDGTLWLNLGDCYATGAGMVGDSPGGGEQGARWLGDVQRHRDERRRTTRDGTHCGKHTAIAARGPMNQPNRMPIPGLKPKDLVGIPWRVAFALQRDGWWIRQDNIWAKRNPMPESVRDRTTRAHEYVFHLSRSENYFYDAVAIEEPQSEAERTYRLRQQARGVETVYKLRKDAEGARAPGNASQGAKGCARSAEARQLLALKGTRNRRSVWSIATQACKEAHFATFPEDLVEPCILAGTSDKGCCATCGTPLVRRLKVTYEKTRPGGCHGPKTKGRQHVPCGSARYNERLVARRETVSWQKSCDCELWSGTVPAIVLDPFMGAGTTALVALKRGRRFIGIDINAEYAEIARRRIAPFMPAPAGVAQ